MWTYLEDLTRAESIEQVRRAVLSLPPAYREVVVLCELQEATYEDARGCARMSGWHDTVETQQGAWNVGTKVVRRRRHGKEFGMNPEQRVQTALRTLAEQDRAREASATARGDFRQAARCPAALGLDRTECGRGGYDRDHLLGVEACGASPHSRGRRRAEAA
ncbi:MAG: hypothetical protein WDO18_14060 [Acidobacteriota bacterium]